MVTNTSCAVPPQFFKMQVPSLAIGFGGVLAGPLVAPPPLLLIMRFHSCRVLAGSRPSLAAWASHARANRIRRAVKVLGGALPMISVQSLRSMAASASSSCGISRLSAHSFIVLPHSQRGSGRPCQTGRVRPIGPTISSARSQHEPYEAAIQVVSEAVQRSLHAGATTVCARYRSWVYQAAQWA